MTRPDFSEIYDDPIDAACCAGYYDGRRPDSPEPGPNDHPMYIHGFKNGRDDRSGTPRASAAEIRRDYNLIRSMLE